MTAFITPLLIFLARIADVSLGTIRITMVSRGYKLASAILGFFEVLIWVIVVAQVLANLDSWINYIAYAGGFAAGNYLGLYLEDKLKVGTIMIRIVTQTKAQELIEALKSAGMAITTVNAKGGFSKVKIIFTVLKRKKLNKVIKIINDIDPDAFYSLEDVKYTNKHKDHLEPPKRGGGLNRLLRIRKGI